jgi:hypothetical protein
MFPEAAWEEEQSAQGRRAPTPHVAWLTFIRCSNVQRRRAEHRVSRGLEEDGARDVRAKRIVDFR